MARRRDAQLKRLLQKIFDIKFKKVEDFDTVSISINYELPIDILYSSKTKKWRIVPPSDAATDPDAEPDEILEIETD